jgi:hypothetical protein
VTPDSSADSTRRKRSVRGHAADGAAAVRCHHAAARSKRFDGRHIYDMRYKANGQGFVSGRVRHASGAPRRSGCSASMARPSAQLDNTAYSRRWRHVSPDGKWIAFTADPALAP